MANRLPKDGGAGSGTVEDSGSAEEAINQAAGAAVTDFPTRYIVENGKFVPYNGPGLVDATGQIAQQEPYSQDYAPFLYNSLTPANRIALIGQLQTAGFINKGMIGNQVEEITAVNRWLMSANAAGLTKDNYLNQKLTGKTPASTGSSRTYRKTNPDDLKAVAKQVAQQTLGRDFTDDEADRFVQAFQAQEVAAQRALYGGGSVMEAPSADVAAQTFAEEQAPTEASAYKTLGYINKFFNAIGGA